MNNYEYQDYYDEEVLGFEYEDRSMNSAEKKEYEYYLFLEQFGDIDFSKLKFTPDVRTV